MTQEGGSAKKPFDPADFPALMEFLPGYLHEDFPEEYGSVQEAVRAFLEDASGDEILGVKEEWRKLRGILDGRALGEKQEALRTLGSAWGPASEAEWNEVDEMLMEAET